MGETKISSCDHSPNFRTGLPITCQVNLKNLENLKIWLDANDAGTVVSTNQQDVDSWSDKSGNSTEFVFMFEKASLIKKQVNNRSAIRLVSDNTEYSSSTLSSFPQNQDFTIAMAFKTSLSNSNKFKMTNGDGNGLDLNISPSGTLSVSINLNEAYSGSFTIKDDVVSKLVIVYSSLTKELLIYEEEKLVGRKIFIEDSATWESLNLSGSEDLELYEILIYNSIKSDPAVAEIQTYLNNKWGF